MNIRKHQELLDFWEYSHGFDSEYGTVPIDEDVTFEATRQELQIELEHFNEMDLENIGGEEPLIVEMRFNIGTPTCTITSLSETYQTIYEALRTKKEVVIKGYNNSARTDAPLWFYPIGYIANSNMATFQCIYNYSENDITAYYLQISSTSNSLSYNQYDMRKQDLSNYVTEEKLAEEIAGASHLTREIVTEIPTVDTAKDNVIYMYKVESATGSDIYQEYQLINGAVVLVGDTSVDLTGYQKLLSGTKGQFVGFDSNGKAVAQSADTSISSASNNPIANKTVFYELAKKQENLAGKGTAGQFVGFTDEGEIDITEDLPVSAGVYAGSTDSRVEITSSSLVIKQHFRKAKLYLSNSLPSSYTVRGGPVTIDIFRLADGTYKSLSTCSPVIIPSAANKLSLYNWNVSANVTEQQDSTLKITTSAGGSVTIIDVSAGTLSGSGSGGSGGDFNHILVWF